jgi:phage gp46-like protein
VRIVYGNAGVAVARQSWDTVWQADLGYADWVIADADEPAPNWGGLQSRYPIETAILLCLFCNARLPDEMAAVSSSDAPSAYRYGWIGDSFDIDRAGGEAPLGSLLFTLARARGDNDTARLAEYYATTALKPLLVQGVVSSFDISCTVEGMADGTKALALTVKAYASNGELLFGQTWPSSQWS